MSTIKSSTEHLTLNADGSGKDIKFQANGVEKASISSAGAFTSTSIDATKLSGDLPAIDGASLTGFTSSQMPAGSVLQVVNGTHASVFTTTSTTYADTGLEATITPSSTSNSILILVTVPLRKHNTASHDTAGHIKIIRGSTDVQEFGRYMAWNNTASDYAQESVSFCYKDSSANTTSATTYKVQLKASISGNSISSCHDSAQASITLMEIGA